MNVTLKDIAKLAHVSTATVSLVLNNKGNISSETRERILEAIHTLNYTRSVPANSLPLDQQKTIKFLRIVKHGQVINRDHDVFITDYLDGLTQGARELNYKLEVNSFTHTSVDEIIRSTLNDTSLDGAIVLATELNKEDMQRFQLSPIPVIFIDNYNEFLPFDFVDMDNKSSIYKAFKYVVSLGYTKIGFIASYTDTNNFKIRETAYRESIALHPEMEPYVISVESTYAGSYNDVNNFLDQMHEPPCPVYLCSNDIMALGAMQALKEHGYRIPEDVSLIGFDNLPQTNQTEPPLATIEVSKRQIARLAVQQLHSRIIEPDIPTVRSLVGGKLIIRDSLHGPKHPATLEV